MLTLTRKQGQRILIGGAITIEVKEIRGRQVRIGINAPAGMPVMREELHAMIAAENTRAARNPDLRRLEQLAPESLRRTETVLAPPTGASAIRRRRHV